MNSTSKTTTPTGFNKLYTPLLALFFLFLLGFILTTHTHWGLTWDERWYMLTGLNILKRVIEFFGGTAGFTITDYEQNSWLFDLHLLTHGVLFDLVTVAFALALGSLHIDTLHLIRALLFGIPTFFLLERASRRLFGAFWGFASMLFLLLMPSYFGHIFNNPIDIPTTFVFALQVWYIIYFLNSNQSRSKLLVLALCIALAVTQRIVLAYLIPVNIIVLFLYNRTRHISISTTMKRVCAILVISLFFMHIIHPYLLSHPVIGLKDMFLASKSFTSFPHPILFDGVNYPRTELPWYYLPKTIAITIPLATLVFFILGTIFGLITIFSRKYPSDEKIRVGYLLAIFIVPILTVFTLRPVLYDSWRHFLFLSIPIVLIATYGLKRTYEFIALLPSRVIHPTRIFLVLVLIMQIILTTREMVHLHPYQYLYYNSLVGGLKGAYQKYETDYWSAGYREAVAWLIKHLDGKHARVFLTGHRFSSSYFFDETLTESTDIHNTDYILTFTRWGADREVGGHTIHTISRHGVPIIFIRTPAREPSSRK